MGIDLVAIERFARWYHYSDEQLCRVFSRDEVAYCRLDRALFAERCAARFAAREACYKALSLYMKKPILFAAFCRALSIEMTTAGPVVCFAREHLSCYVIAPSEMQISLSWSHTESMVVAGVVVLVGA